MTKSDSTQNQRASSRHDDRDADATRPDRVAVLAASQLDVERRPVMMWTTVADALLGKRIAHVLVEEGLAACVNLGAESLSMYMWQGVLEGATEITLTIKTTAGRVQDVASRLGDLHPYEVPEILVADVHGGSRAYLDWMCAQTAR